MPGDDGRWTCPGRVDTVILRSEPTGGHERFDWLGRQVRA